MRFALVQRSLDAMISRQAMEDASRSVPAVAVADCARLHRDLFGIVVRNLDRENAEAFRSRLLEQGFETDVVPEEHLPRLVPGRRGMGLHVGSDAVVETDLYGRAHAHPVSAWVFAAAGRVWRKTERQETRIVERDLPLQSLGHRLRPRPEVVTRTRREEALTLRIDFFFARDPVRVEWVVDVMGGLSMDGRPVRLRDEAAIGDLLSRVRARLPPGRVNRGIERFGAEDAPEYPSLQAYEEEVVWHFYRLRGAR